MTVFALVGGQWGDEGKGKVIDYLAEKADMVIRFWYFQIAPRAVGHF